MPDDDARRQLRDQALVAAQGRLGCTLSPVGDLLPGGDRAVVVRARRSDSGETVIVKGYDAARAGEGWLREAAALTSLSGRRSSAPEVLAVTAAPPVVVMEDLGAERSLATALLADDAADAERATVEWAEAVADLHAATWNDVSGFETALAGLAGPWGADPDDMPKVLADGVERLRRAAALVGLEVDDRVGEEIRGVAEVLGQDVRVLSPFDACPDNNVRTGAGGRLIDFEGATVAHPAWDVAYLRVPWPTCWCAWALPPGVSGRAEEAWRRRLEVGLAARGVSPDWAALDAAVGLASLTWCLVTVGWFLPGARLDRYLGGQDDGRSPRSRAAVRHRLGLVATSDAPELSASAELAARLGAALDREWLREPLQLAPAFRGPAEAALSRP